MNFDGLLFFPVTPFDEGGGSVATGLLAEHVGSGVDAGAGGVFAACGTGEFHALGQADLDRVIRGSVQAVRGRVPVIAGAGGPLPHALAAARMAADAGADGLLLLPPYLVNPPEAGLHRYIEEVATVTDLPVIVYQRNNARFTPREAARLALHPKIVGFKDGLGDVELMQRIVLSVRETAGDEFMFFNGLPTAEVSVPAYRAVGVPLYSSAVFAFAPEIATAFHRAVTKGDDDLAQRLLAGFFRPFAELRDKVPGYAVSLVKAGVRLRGLDVGGVRPPLTDPEPHHVRSLGQLIATGLEIVQG